MLLYNCEEIKIISQCFVTEIKRIFLEVNEINFIEEILDFIKNNNLSIINCYRNDKNKSVSFLYNKAFIIISINYDVNKNKLMIQSKIKFHNVERFLMTLNYKNDYLFDNLIFEMENL